MIVYSIVMFVIAAALIVIGVLVCRGRTELIHAYHQKRVTDKAGYGRAMGKALWVVSLPLIAAGVTAFFTDSIALTLILLVGLPLSFLPLARVQRKYNKGMF